MAEEKVSVLFPSTTTTQGRSQGQQTGWSAAYSEGLWWNKDGEKSTDPDSQGIQGYIASAAGKNHTSVLCIGIRGNKAQRDLTDWRKPSWWGWGRSGHEVHEESATIR